MRESRTTFQSKDIKEKGHLVDLGIDGNVISQYRSASTYLHPDLSLKHCRD
jgi:hypothetical protein